MSNEELVGFFYRLPSEELIDSLAMYAVNGSLVDLDKSEKETCLDVKNSKEEEMIEKDAKIKIYKLVAIEIKELQ